MRARDKERLGAIRLILAAIKQVEVDERVDVLEDARVLGVLQKMIKQRRDAIEKFESASRQDLADKEAFEIAVIQAYMPQPEPLPPNAVVEKNISDVEGRFFTSVYTSLSEIVAVLNIEAALEPVS